MTLNIVIKGAPVTKKNSQEMALNRKTGRWFPVPSPHYKDYRKYFLYQIKRDMQLMIDMPVNVKCVYYMPTRRTVDLVNLLEATNDLLVDARVLKDDNCSIVATHDGSCVRHDKENPRVEIEIKPKAEGR